MAVSSQVNVGPLLREWRERRRLSQLELALDAGISARHLSFVETGRSIPSAEMVLLLAEQLEVPVRERNHLLLAAGYAPAFPQRSLEDPELAPVREALDLILTPLMRLRTGDGRELSFFGTVATFGTAAEVTTSELSIELFFPADAATAEALQNVPRR